MQFIKALYVFLSLAVVPMICHADLGYTAKDAHLRAGPAKDYPVVAILPTGTALSVEGCLNDYSWCDVVAGGDRGWVYAGNILYPWEGSNVPVLSYGPRIGVGIVAFSLGTYWGEYYRGRSWYPQRQRWYDRPRHVRTPSANHPRPPVSRIRPGGRPRPGAGRTPQSGHAPAGGSRPSGGHGPGGHR